MFTDFIRFNLFSSVFICGKDSRFYLIQNFQTGSEQGGQIIAVNKFHRKKMSAVNFADVENAADVGVRKIQNLPPAFSANCGLATLC